MTAQFETDDGWFNETTARRAALAEYRAMLAMGFTHEQAALAASHLMRTVESDFGELDGPKFGEASPPPTDAMSQ
jgi:hypothetical protein